MFISMETDKDIGGVCGYMGLKPERNMDEAGHYIDGYDPGIYIISILFVPAQLFFNVSLLDNR